MTRLDWTFAALVAVQGCHSIEEYLGRLWEVFPPARFVTGLISEDHRFGFIVINLAFIGFGVWCFFWPVRRRWVAAGVFLAFWIVVELINGVGHPLWSLQQGSYTPGVITAPLLGVLAVALIFQRANGTRQELSG